MTLLTAFDPFGGSEENYSMLACNLIPETDTLNKAQIPVEYWNSYKKLDEILFEGDYDNIVLVGQAGARQRVTIEKIAINWAAGSIADNGGYLAHGEKLVPEGPDGIFSTVDVTGIVDQLKAEGFDVAVSYSAGSYVCNALYYQTLINNPDKKIVFVHVPAKDAENSAEIIRRVVAQLS